MKWSSRFIGFLVVTACLVVTFVFVSKETFSWLQTIHTPAPISVIEMGKPEEAPPPKGGIDLGSTDEKGNGGERQVKEDMLKFKFGSGNGDAPGGLGTLFAFLAAIVLTVYGVRRWLRRRRGKGFTFSSRQNAFAPLSLNADTSIEARTFPMLTNIELRDWLITFNASLAPELKLRTNETVVDWFERIELTDIDASLYHLIRYGPASDRDIPFEQQQRFYEALDRYLKRQP
ncbi:MULTISPECIES: hypothetical protein [unclassified Exiguobacterium]|uniref:hypothetical protein n=1 Tax=Exiguobacterium TaxID=33986 RepID=UPI00103FAFA3|nr:MULTISPECIES: hypothetical protein [unclassified Exiguobacterium]TCI69160.1 hypothetical protein EVJ19_09245 [Exiguobacterium sp. IPCI3]TCI78619.1 hypothetical protein EVJ18_09245 [Exiguobacterium sp. IPCH1]TCI81123.1 hypothetical protein EVJ17_09245 [Exiguobacterium sp. IPBC4]